MQRESRIPPASRRPLSYLVRCGIKGMEKVETERGRRWRNINTSRREGATSLTADAPSRRFLSHPRRIPTLFSSPGLSLACLPLELSSWICSSLQDPCKKKIPSLSIQTWNPINLLRRFDYLFSFSWYRKRVVEISFVIFLVLGWWWKGEDRKRSKFHGPAFLGLQSRWYHQEIKNE